jgi:hypothetical protein
MSRLQGIQYVRLAPGAAQAVAPYAGASPDQIEELVLDLRTWPEEIRPRPLPARDGLRVAGDPVLIDAGDDGLYFAREANGRSAAEEPVLVRWSDVLDMQVLYPLTPGASPFEGEGRSLREVLSFSYLRGGRGGGVGRLSKL